MKNQKGFSLLEVLASLVMLSGAVVLSMRSMDTISTGQGRIRNFAKAHNVGISVMEQLLAVYASDAKLTVGNHTATFDRDGNVTAVGAFFTVTWTVAADTPIVKILSIQMHISWRENGRQRIVNFQTFRES
jgi:prepilin-type N-terminal cleavage/methylation domain-containing protein